MKRKFFVVIALIIGISVSLLGCTPEAAEIKEPITVDVGTVEEFIALKDKLTSKYKSLTVNLTADLDFSSIPSYSPIGQSSSDAFSGTFNGNNHKISNIKITQDFSAIGIFGYAKNASFSNLTIENFVSSAKMTNDINHFGSLIGIGYNDIKISDITVNAVTFKNDITYTNVDTVISCNQLQYAGGVIGHNYGNLTATNITVTGANINNISSDLDYYGNPLARLVNAYVGGVFGYAKGMASLENINVASANFNIYSVNAFVGGIVGGIENATIKKGNVDSFTKYFVNASRKINAGGLAGIIDKTIIDNSSVKVEELKLSLLEPTDNSFTVGGLIGIAHNESQIKNSQAEAKIVGSSITFGGGAVGMLLDSNLDNITAKGKFRLLSDDESGNFDISTAPFSIVKNYAGLVGKVYGGSTIKNVTCDFYAYQGLVGEASNKIITDPEGTLIADKCAYFDIDNQTSTFLTINCLALTYVGDDANMKFNNYGSAK